MVKEKFLTSGSAGMLSVLLSESASSSRSYSTIEPWIFAIASRSCSEKSASGIGAQVHSCLPYCVLSSVSCPSTISGLSTKYWLMVKPSALLPRCTQSGSASMALSRFCRNRISAATCVPAFCKKALLGKRTAPKSSARWAIYFLTAGFFLSIVPELVTKARIPPGRSLSSVLAKK